MPGPLLPLTSNNLLDLPTDILSVLVKDYLKMCDWFALSFCCKRLLQLVRAVPLPPGLSWNRRKAIAPIVFGLATIRGFVDILEWLYKLTGKCYPTAVKGLATLKDPAIRNDILAWYKKKPQPPEFWVAVVEMAAAAGDPELVKANWRPRLGGKDFYSNLGKFLECCRRSGNMELIILQAKTWPKTLSEYDRSGYKMIKFKTDDGSTVSICNDVLDDVALSRNVETAKRLVAAGFRFGPTGVANALKSNCKEMVMLASANPRHLIISRREICYSWAMHGSKDTASVLPSTASELYPRMMALASTSANCETLDYMYKEVTLKPTGDELAGYCIRSAPTIGDKSPSSSKKIKFLEHLKKNYGFVPTKELAKEASSEGEFKVLKWIVDNGLPYDREECIKSLTEHYELCLDSERRNLKVKRSRVEEELSKRGIKMARTDD
jgi:hypothetical protein